MDTIRMRFKQYLAESTFNLNVGHDCTFGELLAHDPHLKECIQEMLMEEEHGPEVYKKLLACKMNYKADVTGGRQLGHVLKLANMHDVSVVIRFQYFKNGGFDSTSYHDTPIFIKIRTNAAEFCYKIQLRSNWEYQQQSSWTDATFNISKRTHNFDLFRNADPETIPGAHNPVYAWIPFV